MPFIWAKKANLFEDVSTSDMFYPPPGTALSKKERLGLIWLASNYDPEKYKKIVPARDCEGANIVRICHAIMNPTYPYALRLSAQLLLGTVRVYRTKAKLLLELAEQMLLKLSSLIKEANTRNFDLAIPTLRAEAITLAETGMGMVDYSLEPVYYDPQMIMHVNDGDFITIGGTPLQSPIKPEKPRKVEMKSPLQVSNRKISIQEDLLSPNRPIQLPGEEDLAFGPAQDDFLSDLNLLDVVEFRMDEPQRLDPVFEEDNEDIRLLDGRSQKRKAKDDLDEVFANEHMELNDDEPVMNIDEILKASKNLLSEFTDYATAGTTTDEERVEDVIHEASLMQTDLHGAQHTVVGSPRDWEVNLVTPADAIVLKPKPSHPKKKRKLKVDKEIIISGNEMRNNLAKPERLIRVPIIAGTSLSKGKNLFSQPIVSDFRCNKRLREWWQNNACVPDNPQRDENMSMYYDLPHRSETTSDENMSLPPTSRSPETARKQVGTPGSVDIPRAGEASVQSLEQSGATLFSVNQTPVEDADKTITFDDLHALDIGTNQSPRVSGIGVLPQHVEVDFESVPDLEPVQEIDETLMFNNVIEENYGHDEVSVHFKMYRRKISRSLEDSNETTFHHLFPTSRTKRRDAALAFYTTLYLHKSQYLRLEQKKLFGDISITRVSSR